MIVRVLGAQAERRIAADPRSFVLPDGGLDFPRLLRQFAEFWRENGEVLVNGERAWQREAIELKVWRPERPDPTPDGLRQLDAYLDRLGLDQGTLVVFDRRPDAPPLSDRISFTTDRTPTGHPVTLLRA